MIRTLDAEGFHTQNGERFWSRPLYGPNRFCFVPAGELPHAAFMWFAPTETAPGTVAQPGQWPSFRGFVRCGHFLPGVVSTRGTRWLYQAEDITATYDPGMLRFAVKDPAWNGTVTMELVPLAPGDGYAVRVTAAASVELAFAFGGFLCLSDKDAYQGTGEPPGGLPPGCPLDLTGVDTRSCWQPPGGIVEEHYAVADYTATPEGVSVATLRDVRGKQGESLGRSLRVALLTDAPTRASLHAAQTGSGLAELLKQPASSSSVQVHRIALEPEKPLHLVVLIPELGDEEAALREARGAVAATFDRCAARVRAIARRAVAETPDTLVDLALRSLNVTMDALWSPPVFLHGPIRWGFPGLAGWRMAYGADIGGTYDRVASHCRYYGDGRIRGGLDRQPCADPTKALTRQAPDSLLFSDGAIVNFGIYNMTEMWLSFVAHHYDWTGDRDFLRALWPAIRDALAFEKRVLDRDGDSLYENYANTYITDAHWHNGGNCTQASAYVHTGNLLAAEAARLAGEDPAPYLAEAARIRVAMNRTLWLPAKGVFAEWQDTVGEKLLHPEPELASIYLPALNGVADEFQTYQMLRYTEWGLPNQVIEETGPQPFDGFYRPSSTYAFPQPMRAREVKSSNWRPIVLTVHECSPGELMDLARVYYTLGLADRAFPLLKAVLRCMVNLPTVGGLVIRDRNTEAWSRSWAHNDVDHCDTTGTTLQCIAEGLFGIRPRLGEEWVEIQPGFPTDWEQARIELRDLSYSFVRQGTADTFTNTTSRPTAKRLRLVMRGDGATATVNGAPAGNARIMPGIGHPFIEVDAPKGTTTEFAVTHAARPLPTVRHAPVGARGLLFAIDSAGGDLIELKDPQGVFAGVRIEPRRLSATVVGTPGHHTAFVRVRGQAVEFWQPVDLEIRNPIEIVEAEVFPDARGLTLALRNNGPEPCDLPGVLAVGGKETAAFVRLAPRSQSTPMSVPLDAGVRLMPGFNPVTFLMDGKVVAETAVECWDLFVRAPEREGSAAFVPFDIASHFNDNLALVHTHEYLSPRSPYCSLQIGADLYREWCSQYVKPCGELDLSLLKQALRGGILHTVAGIPFRIPAEGRNIVFVSQWDNYPSRVTIPVGQTAGHVYLLMASVTNPMQSGVVNGRVVLDLEGGAREVLELINPGNLSWCVTHPPHLYGPPHVIQPAVPLGEHVVATLYSLPLRAPGRIESLVLEAVSNESVIGLMGVTLA